MFKRNVEIMIKGVTIGANVLKLTGGPEALRTTHRIGLENNR